MEFNYSEEQLALQDTLQRFISRDYDFDKRRKLSASALGYSAEAWSQFAELGLLALPFPEDFGGLGAASDSMKQKLLPQIAAGTTKLSLAAYEAAGRYELSYVGCTAQETGGSWRLSGRKTVVLDGASADYFLVSARSSGKLSDRDGITLFLVPRDAKGLTVAAYPTQSGARAADLQLENVALAADALIGAPSRALPIIERAVDRAIAALCAEAVGIIIVSHYFKRLTMIDLSLGDADYHLASFSDTLRPAS